MSKNTSSELDAKYLILEAMSSIHHLFMKMGSFKLSGELQDRLLRSYSNMQHVRDDSTFLELNIDLNDEFMHDQAKKRISELRNPPFNLTMDVAIKFESESNKTVTKKKIVNK